MLLGDPTTAPKPGAPKLLLVKARNEDHEGDSSAPPLGVLQIGAAARAWSGWDVRAIDLWLEDDEESAVRDALARFPASVVGVSALTSESASMYRAAAVARAAAPNASIIAGGPHASAYPKRTLEAGHFDGIVVGEGEVTLCGILDRIARGESWQDVPGTVVPGANGSPLVNPAQPFIEDLDGLPFPAWDLTDIDAYSRRRGMALVGVRRYLPILTSRGCPYRCTYCHDIHGKRFRPHSPGYVLDLIRQMIERHDVRHFDICDDIINLDTERLETICEGLIALDTPIHFTLPNGLRADRLEEGTVDKLVRAGLEFVSLAVETASPRLQKQIRKNLKLEKVSATIDAFSKRGVLTTGFFMLGFPSETEEEMQSTIDFALESNLHVALFFIVSPFEGTELYEQLRDRLELDTVDLTRVFADQQINLSDVPDDRFLAMRRRAYARFYLHPLRMLRILKAFPRRASLLRLAAAMIALTLLNVSPSLVYSPFSFLSRKIPRRSSARVSCL